MIMFLVITYDKVRPSKQVPHPNKLLSIWENVNNFNFLEVANAPIIPPIDSKIKNKAYTLTFLK